MKGWKIEKLKKKIKNILFKKESSKSPGEILRGLSKNARSLESVVLYWVVNTFSKELEFFPFLYFLIGYIETGIFN